MLGENAVLEALRRFAAEVTEKMSHPGGEPEEQLRAPFEAFMGSVGEAVGPRLVCKGETLIPGRVGKPDYAIHSSGALTGYVELKAPGKDADPDRYSGHDLRQWKRFQAIPNLIYTDGNSWALYRSGECEGRIVHLAGDVTSDGVEAVEERDARRVLDLITNFLSWSPIIPTDRRGRLILDEFSEMLAPLCRMLRENVVDALSDADSPLVHLAADWRDLLFPEADDGQFADAYAQTVTFALLLARSEGADPLTLREAERALSAEHSLLSRALKVLTDPAARAEISASVDLLLRIIGEADPAALSGPEDPWLHFYEDFLAAYDPKLRKDAGAYYTPVEVVRAQVRLIDDLLSNRLHRPMGFAEEGVVTLDPGVGTGTYLLGVIEHALEKVEAQEGAGAVPGRAGRLARNLYGFEFMVGPFAVSQLRVSRALEDRGAELPEGGPHVYLTDTLESPHAEPPQLPLWLAPISDQHRKALRVKESVPVIVCLGNPPYDRHDAVSKIGKARAGGWVRWGETQQGEGLGDGTGAILDEFIRPAIDAGHGGHVKNLYNLYVYFWRWALWKVFEAQTAEGPGVVSFISASSYLDGDAFVGMREHMRRVCEEVWIIDLGGEGRGTRRNENVFAIQTPVAIAVAVSEGEADGESPAKVHYARFRGTEAEKRAELDSVTGLDSIEWKDCHERWQAPFRPVTGEGAYFTWPRLTDVFPWRRSGVKAGRTWVVAPREETLKRRWRTLCRAEGEGRRELFKDSSTGRKAHDTPRGMQSVLSLPSECPPPEIRPYAYRSFDRQWIFADLRLLDRHGPPLWTAHRQEQIYLTSLFSQPLGRGPAVTAAAHIPDLDHFRGSYGARATMPLYRNGDEDQPNVPPGLLAALTDVRGQEASAEDALAYVYGIMAQPAFTDRFYEQVAALDSQGNRQLRVPITKDAELFERVRAAGAHLLWLHTYGERCVPDGHVPGQVPGGRARCTEAVPGDAAGYPEDFSYDAENRTLHVGEGRFAPVEPEVYRFEVSGLKVVESWLGYRMRDPKGRRSSPLDDINTEKWPAGFTTELLELLWVLEATVEQYPQQEELLEAVIEGKCFTADELPEVPPALRKAPKENHSRLPDAGPFPGNG